MSDYNTDREKLSQHDCNHIEHKQILEHDYATIRSSHKLIKFSVYENFDELFGSQRSHSFVQLEETRLWLNESFVIIEKLIINKLILN